MKNEQIRQHNSMNISRLTVCISNCKIFIFQSQEVVIMVGYPASGKSTFRKQYFEPHGYVAVNRDTLGTVSKCKKFMYQALEEGKSVVVDNTNPSPAAREEFILVAKDEGMLKRRPEDLACFAFPNSRKRSYLCMICSPIEIFS